jgi:hypothetical protein
MKIININKLVQSPNELKVHIVGIGGNEEVKKQEYNPTYEIGFSRGSRSVSYGSMKRLGKDDERVSHDPKR